MLEEALQCPPQGYRQHRPGPPASASPPLQPLQPLLVCPADSLLSHDAPPAPLQARTRQWRGKSGSAPAAMRSSAPSSRTSLAASTATAAATPASPHSAWCTCLLARPWGPWTRMARRR